MKLQIYSPAEEELAAAIDWYESLNPGLGSRFIADFEDVCGRISEFPDAWQKIGNHSHRRCLFEHFPFAAIYRVDGQRVYIVAVMHLHRKPGYWKLRT